MGFDALERQNSLTECHWRGRGSDAPSARRRPASGPPQAEGDAAISTMPPEPPESTPPVRPRLRRQFWNVFTGIPGLCRKLACEPSQRPKSAISQCVYIHRHGQSSGHVECIGEPSRIFQLDTVNSMSLSCTWADKSTGTSRAGPNRSGFHGQGHAHHRIHAAGTSA